MYRVSSSMGQSNFDYHNRAHESQKHKIDGQIQSQRGIARLRDNPVNAAHSVRYQSKNVRLERYQQNVDNAVNRLAIAESSVSEATSILQRIREIAVQGANGTYDQNDLRYMAIEVNEYLEELGNIANAKGGDGLALFSGTRTDVDAFRLVRGSVVGADEQMITGAMYTGNVDRRESAYADNASMTTQFTGNSLFWAENQRIWGASDVAQFVVQQDSSIHIDGVEIPLQAGDGVHALIHKINQADISVRASLDPVENNLVLETTQPHQLWLVDGENSTTLEELGLIVSGQEASTPNNYHPFARVSGGSMFDAVIELRDALLVGDSNRIGGAALGGIDRALDNVNLARAQMGAKHNRLESVGDRLSKDSLTYIQWDDQVRGLDLASALIEQKMLDSAMTASYASMAKVMQPSLMDFLK
ncbi:flagellar hook-associated protein 3 [Entomospira culicis]|uniref:Flagellar hook-associated protein 3 n=1 Tax=Entomospira culicis TaxID=2719989 RepID=A0A968GGN7_9SPIO|nr:flagellar hook-associated protein 3 [Entomospira culicis]NIZ19758.1 flagellar hook-associated protein 3 [Entomospira culicis]NIZ69972.1 flagellar hook-associated protein 3 [Entomospira culicis]WDI37077.1 flagellar hook-associated protein 3 [Entomospira culicis]WDI38706.1 flagellar hook-associated protein 3 [Entomospira culicis]